MSLADRFTLLHELGVYHGRESASGECSSLAETARLRFALPAIIERHSVRSILDIPCGDFHWMRHVGLGEVAYLGADVVAELVEENQRLHAAAGVGFRVLDAADDELPVVDLVLCRDLLIHLSLEDVDRVLRNVCSSGSRLLLTNHFTECTVNRQIVSGDFRPINLCRAPFGFPEPLEVIDERSAVEGGADRAMALWAVDDVRRLMDDR